MTHVALKLLSTPNQAERVRMLNEAVLMSTLNHPNIVKLIGVVTVSDPLILVMEYMPDGSLDGVLRIRALSTHQLIRFCTEICSAMVYLSDNRYIHRDLAASVSRFYAPLSFSHSVSDGTCL